MAPTQGEQIAVLAEIMKRVESKVDLMAGVHDFDRDESRQWRVDATRRLAEVEREVSEARAETKEMREVTDMVKGIRSKMAGAVFVLAILGAIIGSVLGLVKDRILAAWFGA